MSISAITGTHRDSRRSGGVAAARTDELIEVEAKQLPDPTAPTIDAVRAEYALIPGGATVVDSNIYKTGRSSTPQEMSRCTQPLPPPAELLEIGRVDVITTQLLH